eukprot:TRINITY_DN25887_c0_g1_i1.p1 TRINITY_DN25887_c0_g1~~TRINITY_DN25887_c0_g1_i1.p1  ORF type:complete len:166 (+),score=51.03 TRINITY_DN25887_c0_g1_i1:42-539(+)
MATPAGGSPAARWVDVRNEEWRWGGRHHALDGGHHEWVTPEGFTVVTPDRWVGDAHAAQKIGWKWRYTNRDVMDIASSVGSQYSLGMKGVELMTTGIDVKGTMDLANSSRTEATVSVVHDHHGEVSDLEYDHKKRLWHDTDRASTSAYYYPPYDPHVGCNHVPRR